MSIFKVLALIQSDGQAIFSRAKSHLKGQRSRMAKVICHVAQPYMTISYYVHFHKAGINTIGELTWTNFQCYGHITIIKGQECMT